ncbi:hypothetical protein A6B43_03990 [Vespertiliibacter pulmonis]|uniref:Outer membrane protein n=1 Tax=Vespertiliibacter pulmonis TaxID=1443036 RepID=A0A3N4VZP8_9PAST|nr:hypothetical protein [Vespertiliibacter pulmonis]QLB20742.1 hypothetical protein A6B43_03990 [Vespertiliibacter pulmonis]RPE82627.1 hypothetical protein EDC46_1564 [Vespertiliibacter pulmonis]
MILNKFPISLLAIFCSAPLWATQIGNPTAVDRHHTNVQNLLYNWSNTLDDWFGTPDLSNPASANLRIMLDNQWNRYDGYSIKPRIRAKIRLPALKKHFSVVLGDEDIDNQAQDKHQTSPNYREPMGKNKHYDRRQVRNTNHSLALRWSDDIKKWGINTDIDLGIRSGADIFLRVKADKTWQHTEKFSTRLEQIYRYGINSKHYLRTNLENKFNETEYSFINNHTYLEYTHDIDEDTRWGNSIYRQHNFVGLKQLNYGLFFGGEFDSKKFELTHYGPFINWRQPILREWLFIQPEIWFYNSKKLHRKHHVGTFLRLEAVF